MKIALIAFSTDTGLGYQTLDFAKHIPCEKILIVDISHYNNLPTHHERFNDLAKEVKITNTTELLKEDKEFLVEGIDMIFCAETPLSRDLFDFARERGAKTVMQYNYEFLPYMNNPALPAPDVLASPSFWHLNRVEELKLARVEYLPVPVNVEDIKWSRKTKAQTITHIIGRPAMDDRNGTLPFLEAIKLLPNWFQFEIYLQQPKEATRMQDFQPILDKLIETKKIIGDRLQIFYDTPNRADMYRGDILVLPRRYGGLCLPMWEALAAGMPVIMTDIEPNNVVLPDVWLCEAFKDGKLQSLNDIDLYSVMPSKLAEKIEEVADCIEASSIHTSILTKRHSWDTLKPKYMELFQDICKK